MEEIVHCFELNMVFPLRVTDFLKSCKYSSFKRKGRTLWICFVSVRLWSIWNERNKRIFEDIYVGVEGLWESCQFRVALWIKEFKDFRRMFLSDIARGWEYIL